MSDPSKSPDACDVVRAGGLEALRSHTWETVVGQRPAAGLTVNTGSGRAIWPVVRVFDVDEPPEVPFVVADIVPERGRLLLAGTPKQTRKTWTLMHLALCVASGRPFCDFEVIKPGPVVYLSGEERFSTVHKRMALLAKGAGLPRDLLVYTSSPGTPAPRLDLAEDIERIRNMVEDLKPVLLVMEPWARLQRADENDASAVGPILSNLSQLADETGVAIALAHHLAKSGQGFDSIRGSGDLRSWYDTGILASPEANGCVRLEFECRNRPVEPFGLEVSVTEGDGTTEGAATVQRVVLSGTEPVRRDSSLAERILEAVKGNTITSMSQLVRLVGKRRQNVINKAKELAQNGRLDISSTPWRVLP